jgi:enoyl-CoA hydratase
MVEEGKTYDYILVDRDPQKHIGVVTFNRPDKLNAMNQEMQREIADAIDDLEWDDDIKVIIFKGAGRSFCTGGDLSALGRHYGWEDPEPGTKPQRPSVRARLKNDRRSSGFYAKFFYCSKATIAQVHGYAVGGGFDITMACDLAVVAEDAQFGHPGMKIAAPFYDLSQVIWVYKLGMTLMKDLCLTGRVMSAKEAMERQVVTKLVPPEQLAAATMEMAEEVAKFPADGIVLGKTHINMMYNMLGVGNGYNYAWIGHTLGTNMRFEPDEFNFYKERRDRGTSGAFKERDRSFGQEE